MNGSLVIKVLAVFAAILIVSIVFIAPPITRYFATQWLLDNGAANAEIKKIAINPFSGRITIGGVAINDQGTSHVSLDEIAINIGMLNLLRAQFVAESVTVNNLDASIVQTDEGLHLGFFLPVNSSEEESVTSESPDSSNTIDFALLQTTLTQLSVSAQQKMADSPPITAKLAIESGNIGEVVSWSDNKTKLSLQGNLNNASWSLTGTTTLFSGQPTASVSLTLDSLSLEAFTQLLPPEISQFNGTVSTDTKVDLTVGQETIQIAHQGSTALNQLHMEINNSADLAKVSDTKLAWNGQGKVILSGDKQQQISTVGDLSFNVNIAAQPYDVSMNVNQITIDSDIQLADEADINMTASLSIRDTKATDNILNQSLAAIEHIEVNDIVVQQPNVFTVSKFIVHNISLGDLSSSHDSKLPLFTADKFSIDKTKISDKAINIKQVTLANSQQNIRLLADGKLDGIAIIEASADTKTAQTEKQPEPVTTDDQTAGKDSKTPAIIVDNISVVGVNEIAIEDQSVNPPLKLTVEVSSVEISGIDSTQPDQAADVKMKSALSKYSAFELQGHIKPFTEQLNLNLQAKLSQLDLPNLSPYLANSVGYNIKSGAANADITVEITDGNINATNDIKINNFELTPQNQELIAKYAKTISMPLDYAVSILRDKDNNVDLTLPIEGNVNNPEFHINDVINTALKNSLMSASVTYLKYAFQPYGALITIAEVASDKLTEINLDPLFFQPNTTELIPESMPYLEKVSQILQDKKDLRLKLCGKATESDKISVESSNTDTQKSANTITPSEKLVAQEQAMQILLELANQRSEVMRDALVRNGVNSSQLFVCVAELDPSTTGKPRVELSL